MAMGLSFTLLIVAFITATLTQTARAAPPISANRNLDLESILESLEQQLGNANANGEVAVPDLALKLTSEQKQLLTYIRRAILIQTEKDVQLTGLEGPSFVNIEQELNEDASSANNAQEQDEGVGVEDYVNEEDDADGQVGETADDNGENDDHDQGQDLDAEYVGAPDTDDEGLGGETYELVLGEDVDVPKELVGTFSQRFPKLAAWLQERGHGHGHGHRQPSTAPSTASTIGQFQNQVRPTTESDADVVPEEATHTEANGADL